MKTLNYRPRCICVSFTDSSSFVLKYLIQTWMKKGHESLHSLKLANNWPRGTHLGPIERSLSANKFHKRFEWKGTLEIVHSVKTSNNRPKAYVLVLPSICHSPKINSTHQTYFLAPVWSKIFLRNNTV